MEKIQIQFKESDYKIYYDYCLKYYQVHDKARKQSIHAFLDLFEKGIISVEAQDIAQAQDLISRKCEDLKKRPDDTRREDDKTLIPEIWTCGDLLIFIEDLEKIYCLIEKQGVTANYLMILGTFSNVISDEKSSQISVMYDLKSEMIESLADPLADIVQMRMGTHRQWRSALRELTVIAAQFNRQSFEPKFDLGILQLVAPLVISRFNEDVNTKEILSLLPSYFEECELEEFEAFLNRTPDQIKDEHDSDINWDAIYKPLNMVVSAIASQHYKRPQDSSKISDPYSHPPTKEIESPDNRSNSVESPPPAYHDPSLDDGYKTSDIGVSPYLTTQAEYPMRRNVLIKVAITCILVALFIYCVIEFGANRETGPFHSANNEISTDLIDQTNYDLIIMGNSMLNVNVNKTLLEKELSSRTGRPIKILYMGYDSDSLPYYYLLIKNRILPSNKRNIPIVIINLMDYTLKTTHADIRDIPTRSMMVGDESFYYSIRGEPESIPERVEREIPLFLKKKQITASILNSYLQVISIDKFQNGEKILQNRFNDQVKDTKTDSVDVQPITKLIDQSYQRITNTSEKRIPVTYNELISAGFLPEIIRLTHDRFPLIYIDSHMYPTIDSKNLKNFRNDLNKYLDSQNVTYIDLNKREELNNTEIYYKTSPHFSVSADSFASDFGNYSGVPINTRIIAEEIYNHTKI